MGTGAAGAAAETPGRRAADDHGDPRGREGLPLDPRQRRGPVHFTGIVFLCGFGLKYGVNVVIWAAMSDEYGSQPESLASG